jgi:hypothetical protein
MQIVAFITVEVWPVFQYSGHCQTPDANHPFEPRFPFDPFPQIRAHLPKMAGFRIWHHVPGKVLLFLVNVISATSLIFEGKKIRPFSSRAACRVGHRKANHILSQAITRAFLEVSVGQPGSSKWRILDMAMSSPIPQSRVD